MGLRNKNSLLKKRGKRKLRIYAGEDYYWSNSYVKTWPVQMEAVRNW